MTSQSIIRVYTGFVLLLTMIVASLILVPRGIVEYKELQLEERLLQREIGYQKRILSRLQENVDELNSEVAGISDQIGGWVLASAQINDTIQGFLGRVLDKPELMDSINLLYDEKILVIEPRIDSLNRLFEDESETLLHLLQKQDKEIKEQDLREFRLVHLRSMGQIIFWLIIVYGVFGFFVLILSSILWLGTMKVMGK